MSEGIFSTDERIEYDFEDGGALTIEKQPPRIIDTFFRCIDGLLVVFSVVAILPGVHVTPGDAHPLAVVFGCLALLVFSTWARKSRTRVRIRKADRWLVRQWFFGSFELTPFTLRYRISPDAPVRIGHSTWKSKDKIWYAVWLLPEGRSARQELFYFAQIPDAEFCAQAIADLLGMGVENSLRMEKSEP